MSKVVRAANAMISNSSKISGVVKKGDEYFFLYDGKYKWSISENYGGNYSLTYYPGSETLKELAETARFDCEKSVVYNAAEIGGQETVQTFKELFLTVKENLLGVSDALDDIIKDSDSLSF